MTSQRSSSGDDRRRRREHSGKAKSAKSGRGKDVATTTTTTTVDSANWQLKSPADGGGRTNKHPAKPAGGNSRPASTKHVAKKAVTVAEPLNGQAVNDERVRPGRGQTSADVKKRRSTQRQNPNNGLTTNMDDWLTTTSIVVDKKPEGVAVDNATSTMFRNDGCCVLM